MTQTQIAVKASNAGTATVEDSDLTTITKQTAAMIHTNYQGSMEKVMFISEYPNLMCLTQPCVNIMDGAMIMMRLSLQVILAMIATVRKGR